VAADEHARPGQRRLDLFGQLHDLGDVGEIVDREADRVGSPRLQRRADVLDGQHLQVDEAHVVAGRLEGGCDTLDAERLETQEDLRENQWAGMNQQDTRSHLHLLTADRVHAYDVVSRGSTRPPRNIAFRVAPTPCRSGRGSNGCASVGGRRRHECCA
jgi:hypothetical protein